MLCPEALVSFALIYLFSFVYDLKHISLVLFILLFTSTILLGFTFSSFSFEILFYFISCFKMEWMFERDHGDGC